MAYLNAFHITDFNFHHDLQSRRNTINKRLDKSEDAFTHPTSVDTDATLVADNASNHMMSSLKKIFLSLNDLVMTQLPEEINLAL